MSTCESQPATKPSVGQRRRPKGWKPRRWLSLKVRSFPEVLENPGSESVVHQKCRGFHHPSRDAHAFHCAALCLPRRPLWELQGSGFNPLSSSPKLSTITGLSRSSSRSADTPKVQHRSFVKPGIYFCCAVYPLRKHPEMAQQLCGVQQQRLPAPPRCCTHQLCSLLLSVPPVCHALLLATSCFVEVA